MITGNGTVALSPYHSTTLLHTITIEHSPISCYHKVQPLSFRAITIGIEHRKWDYVLFQW
jgi:hypothetical protein